MEKELQARKQKVLKLLKEKPFWIPYLILLVIIIVGIKIRTLNLSLMEDKFPLALDPYVFLRYSTYIAEHGKIFYHDAMRYFPLGYSVKGELLFVSYFTVYLQKFVSFFKAGFTIPQSAIIYPVVAFAIGMVFYFLLTKKLSNNLTALLSSVFLIILPPYLYRTMAGFSDKEALALVFFFAAMFFFISSWVSKPKRASITLGILSGISTGLLALTWGGINLILVLFAAFIFVEIILNKFTKECFHTTLAWLIPTVIMMATMTSKYGGFSGLFSSTSAALVLFVFFIGLVDVLLFKYDVFKIKSKIEKKIPTPFFSLIIGLILLFIVSSIVFQPSFVPQKISATYLEFVQSNVIKSRWTLTVAESHQPYLQDWIQNTNWIFFLTFIAGSIWLFFKTINFYEKTKRLYLTIFFSVLFLAFIFSRYAAGHILDGVSKFSILLYLGSPILFILVLIGLYLDLNKKDKETFAKIKKTDSLYIFALSWTFVMLIAARTQVRLFIILAPVTAFIAAYALSELLLSSKKLKDNMMKIIAIAVVIVVLIFTIPSFYNISVSNAKVTGPSYNIQWQNGMTWVRENTPEDAVFAHWWDYGYWVQTGGQRATITDGGNNIGAWNYYMGRHVLTGQDETEALEFLLPHNATHLLMISDEIGKYPAFSSIGSDVNYDRYSWISSFRIDQQQIRETRNSTVFVYVGGTNLDEDFVYQGKLYPKQSAGIAGFAIPLKTESIINATTLEFEQPSAFIAYNNNMVQVPIQCIYYLGKFYEFDDSGLKGCLRMIPSFETQGSNQMGALLYVSERVRRGLFAQLFLFERESENFKLVYDDSQNLPLALYQGRVVGPLKIWEINYPEGLKYDPIFLSSDVPDPDVYKI